MKHLTLSTLNAQIKSSLLKAFPMSVWLCAEINELKVNQTGHCYLNLIEKEEGSERLCAQARATIWKSKYSMMKPYFEAMTGENLAEGMSVLVKVEPVFHAVYGFSLNILDIDPSYTLGDIARDRALTIVRLKEEGLMNLNKELLLPKLCSRLAIISSSTAAGYEDFLQQILHYKENYRYEITLFSASMQGENTSNSVISALEKIYENIDAFDVVLILRGGGSIADLRAFDAYEIAANCAQFPLPVLTGIGHEKDISVLDMIAFRSMKTPTALAQFLLSRNDELLVELDTASIEIKAKVQEILADKRVEIEKLHVQIMSESSLYIAKLSSSLTLLATNLIDLSQNLLQRKKHQLDLYVQEIDLLSPFYLLKRGYSFTMHNGSLANAKKLKDGDKIETVFYDGKVTSIVNLNEKT